MCCDRERVWFVLGWVRWLEEACGPGAGVAAGAPGRRSLHRPATDQPGARTAARPSAYKTAITDERRRHSRARAGPRLPSHYIIRSTLASAEKQHQ